VVVKTILDALTAEDDVRITGFSLFDVMTREARQGRHPKIGETVEVPATKAVRFRARRLAKDQMNAA
jgi:DNA-binding protein HU-beta